MQAGFPLPLRSSGTFGEDLRYGLLPLSRALALRRTLRIYDDGRLRRPRPAHAGSSTAQVPGRSQWVIRLCDEYTNMSLRVCLRAGGRPAPSVMSQALALRRTLRIYDGDRFRRPRAAIRGKEYEQRGREREIKYLQRKATRLGLAISPITASLPAVFCDGPNMLQQLQTALTVFTDEARDITLVLVHAARYTCPTPREPWPQRIQRR